MQPLLFVDLDRTLFDTDRFFTFIENVIIHDFQVSTAEYEKVRPLYAVQVEDQLLRYSDFDEILLQLSIAKDEFQQVVLDKEVANTFLLDDAPEFINWLYDCKTHEVRILSFGQQYFQMLKLLVSPALNNIPEHIVLTRKNDFISKEYGNRAGILIDDKPNQELPAGWSEIHIDRNNDSNTPIVQNEATIRITTLLDAPKYIHSAHS